MTPRIVSIVRNHTADHPVAYVQSPHSHCGVDESKSLEPQARDARSDNRCDKEDDTRHDVQDVVRDVDHEKAKVETVLHDTGNKTEQAAEKKCGSHEYAEASNHDGIFLWHYAVFGYCSGVRRLAQARGHPADLPEQGTVFRG